MTSIEPRQWKCSHTNYCILVKKKRIFAFWKSVPSPCEEYRVNVSAIWKFRCKDWPNRRLFSKLRSAFASSKIKGSGTHLLNVAEISIHSMVAERRKPKIMQNFVIKTNDMNLWRTWTYYWIKVRKDKLEIKAFCVIFRL